MPTDWQHLLFTNETNSDDEFDKDEREGCDAIVILMGSNGPVKI